MAKATFSLNLSGYIVPNNLQKELDNFDETSYGIAEVNIETTTVVDINNLPLNNNQVNNGNTGNASEEPC